MDNRISAVNFKGLWAPVVVREVSNGFKPCKEYTSYKLYDLVYHPFKSETVEEIANAVKKFIKGRTYNMVDFKEGQNIGDYYQMNRVKVGKVIDEKDMPKYLEKGFTKEMHGGISSEEDFWKAMSNDSYDVMDYCELTPEYINKLAGRVFNKIS